MIQKKIKDFRFYFQTESVIMEHRRQYVSFNNFNSRNKLPLQRFRDDISKTRKMDINKVFHLAHKHKVDAYLTTSRTVAHLTNINRISQ